MWQDPPRNASGLRRLDRRLARHLAALGPVEPAAMWKAVAAWSAVHEVPVHAVGPEKDAPILGTWQLDRLTRREGFEAASPHAAANRLFDHYVSRVPSLGQWRSAWAAEAGRNVAREVRQRPRETVVVVAAPWADVIADGIQAANRS
jgi:hypothetical protein